MQIKIDLKIFAIVILFLLTKNIGIYALLMFFALIHELSHLICGILLGFKPKSISVVPYGFNLSFKINCLDYNKKIVKGNIITLKRIIIALAGPFSNLICIVFIVILKKNFNVNQYQNLIYANILLVLFNLFPIYPLDGGRIMQGIIHIFCGLRKSYVYTKFITNINIIILTAISSILILYYKNIAILLAIIYLWILVYKCNKEYNLKEKLYNKIDNISQKQQKDARIT